MSSKPTTSNPPSVRPPKPTYSHICTTPLSPTSTLVTIAGQIGAQPDGTIPPAYADQVRVALANLSKCLEAAGATTRDIVSVRHYEVNYDPSNVTRRQIYTDWIGEHRPPSTLVGVAALAEEALLYEIEAMAVVSR